MVAFRSSDEFRRYNNDVARMIILCPTSGGPGSVRRGGTVAAIPRHAITAAGGIVVATTQEAAAQGSAVAALLRGRALPVVERAADGAAEAIAAMAATAADAAATTAARINTAHGSGAALRRCLHRFPRLCRLLHPPPCSMP